MWCCLDIAGPEGQSSSTGAAINGFNRVEEAVSLSESFWLDLAEEVEEGRFLVCVSQAGMRLPV